MKISELLEIDETRILEWLIDNQDKYVLVSEKEYTALNDRDHWLNCLEAAGVDNWEGFDYAHEIKEEWGNE